MTAVKSGSRLRAAALRSGSSAVALALFVVLAHCGNNPSRFGSPEDAGGEEDDASIEAGLTEGDSGSLGDDEGGSLVVADAGPIVQVDPVSSYIKDDCASALPAPTVAALKAGGSANGLLRWLYPYDRTVFPGGIAGPLLQWVPQGAEDAAYVHFQSKKLDYKICFRPSAGQWQVPNAFWARAWAQSGGKGDPLTVTLTTSTGGAVTGPIKESWTFALGSLKGSIYYNTYTSPLAQNNGAVMRIQPGGAEPVASLYVTGSPLTGPCISCHSLSANGSMLVAQKHVYPPGLVDSEAYNLQLNPAPDAKNPYAINTVDDWGFSAVYPDGSRLLTDGAPGQTNQIFPAGEGSNPGMEGPFPSRLYDTKTGQALPMSGLGVQFAKMPMFSPDGKKLVFTEHDVTSGHALVVVDFDASTNTFSNPKTIFKDSVSFPGWAFFTPDAKAVVFALGNSKNYASLTNPPAGPVTSSDLYIVDVATGKAHPLDDANGMHGGSSYLPYPGRDEHLSFYPTVSPVAAGGYFWAYFTSRRNYGNVINGSVDDSKSKKIWVTAIDIGAAPGTEASHPAFYLPGQELESGNIRAFATLDPCKANGSSCTSGIDCCNGSCNGGICKAPTSCANLDDKCTKASDCCTKGAACLGGYCSIIIARSVVN